MYDQETKRQSATWLSPKKPKAQKWRVRRMFTAFFDAKRTIHHEFVPKKQTVNGKFYKEAIKISIARVHCVRPDFRKVGPGIFCTTMHRRILRALSPNFWPNEGTRLIPWTLFP
jgi:hypothetical protein